MPKSSGMVLKRPQLTISIKLIKYILNMLLKVLIDRSQPQYFMSTEVDRNTP